MARRQRNGAKRATAKYATALIAPFVNYIGVDSRYSFDYIMKSLEAIHKVFPRIALICGHKLLVFL